MTLVLVGGMALAGLEGISRGRKGCHCPQSLVGVILSLGCVPSVVFPWGTPCSLGVFCPQRNALNLFGQQLRSMRVGDVSQFPLPQGPRAESLPGHVAPNPGTVLLASAQGHDFRSHSWFYSSADDPERPGGQICL